MGISRPQRLTTRAMLMWTEPSAAWSKVADLFHRVLLHIGCQAQSRSLAVRVA